MIALAIRGYRRWVDRVYAFDLAGAGIGALAIVPLLWLVDAPTLFVALGIVAGVAALLFAGRRGPEAGAALAATAAAVVLAGLAAATSLYSLAPSVAIAGRVDPVSDRWTPLSRVLGFPPAGPGARFAAVNYDRVYAPVPLHHRGEPLPDWRELDTGPQSIGYAMTGAGTRARDRRRRRSRHRERPDAGPARGRDRAERRDPEDRGRGPGALVRRALLAAGGEHRDRRRPRDPRSPRHSYDTVHLGFTDTLSTNSAQAFALTENNLYTREAFEEYLDHLRPGGVLNVSRLYHARRRRGAQSHGPDTRRAEAARRGPAGAKRRGRARPRHLQRALRDGAGTPAPLDAGGAGASRAPGARARRRPGLRPRRAVPARVAGPGPGIDVRSPSAPPTGSTSARRRTTSPSSST